MSDSTTTDHVISDQIAIAELRKRLRRAEGQIGGIIRMLDDGRSCQDIVTQLAAVSKAIDKSAFSLISTGLRECITDGKHNAEEVAVQLQKLFLTMA
ncbi:MAG: metal-sensing transcriptional repressor [Actinobacteria bacterium]|uniref:Unannotated protein n=1 Tax=freshwater metagenome TaxID=449393 RepID=A0A6J5Z6S7_9ZZZZ|nr:metal-sensing transcriptional repressor [Actinomycetota bacterium]